MHRPFNRRTVTSRSPSRTIRLVGEQLEDRITPTISFGYANGNYTGSWIGDGVESVAIGDFTGSGVNDIAIADYATGVSIVMNEGGGNFNSVGQISVGGNPTIVKVADMFDNTIEDLIVGCQYNSMVYVVPGNGNGTFGTPIPIALNYNVQSLAVAELVPGGLPDIVVGVSGGMAVVLSNGSGGYDTPVYYNANNLGNGSYVAAGDFFGNGYQDVAVSGSGDAIDVYPNNGNGTFGTPSVVNDPTGYQGGSIVAGSFTRDGNTDLAVNYQGTTAIGVLLGNGNGTFQAPVWINTGLSGSGTGSIAVADFDLDGNLDLAFINYSGEVVIPGNGLGGFGNPILITGDFNSPFGGSGLAIGDLNGDGYPDLADAGFNVVLNSSGIDPERSSVSFDSGTVAPGGTDAVTIVVENSAGDPTAGLTNGDFDLSLSGGTSAGTFGNVTETSTPGTYTAIFTADQSGTPTQLTVSVDSEQIDMQPTVQVTSPSGTNSSVSFESPSVASGSTDAVTIVAEDDNGNAITGLTTGDFDFNLSGSSTGSFGAVTETATPGTYAANFTGIIAGGTSTLVLDIGGVELTSRPQMTVTPGTPDPNNTTVSFETSTLASGTVDTITIGVNDAAGNAIPNLTTNNFILNLSRGSSTGTFGSVTESDSPGTYTASFTAVKSGTAANLSVTVENVQINEDPTVEVTPGSVDSATSVVELSASGVISGSSATVTLQAVDAAGNDLTSGGATVAFALGSTGGGQGTFGPVTDNHNGTYTATVTGTVAGSNTVTATINGHAVTTTAPTLTVTPGPIDPATSFEVLSVASVVSGSSATVTLQAVDAAGNDLTSGGATVAFALGTTGGGQGTFGPVTDNRNGTYTSTVTGTVAGSNTVTVTINGHAVTTTAPAITVTPGSVDSATSVVELSASGVISGSSATVTLQAVDAAGNDLTSGGATVAFALGSTGGGQGTFGPVTDNHNGIYTTTFTGTLAGDNTITAAINGHAVTTTAPTLTVTPGPIDPATSFEVLSVASVVSGSSVTVGLQAVDAAGNDLTSGGARVAFAFGSSGGGQGTFGPVTDYGNGTYTATFTGTIAGSNTITATINGHAVTTIAPPVTITPGPVDSATSAVELSAVSVASGSLVTVALQAKDAAGNDLTSGGATVAFALGTSGGGQGTFGPVTDNSNGTYAATFTGSVAGSNTITATINGHAVTTLAPTFTVTPGSVDPATSFVELSAASVASGSSDIVSLQAVDAAGNVLSSGGATVAFALGTAGGGQGTFGPVTDHGNGTYTAIFTGILVGSNVITAAINGHAVTTTAPAVTITLGPIGAATSFVGLSEVSVSSGNSCTITLQAVDVYGNNLTVGGLHVAFVLGSTAGGQGKIGAVTDDGNGKYTATFTGTISGTNTITATIDGEPVTSTAPSITVTPGLIDLSHSQVSTVLPSVQLGGETTVVLQGEDSYGNLETTGGATNIAFELENSTGGHGAISSVKDNGNGTYTAIFIGTVDGPNTIEATIGGSPVTSTTPVSVTGAAVNLADSLLSVAAATVQSGSGIQVSLQAESAKGVKETSGGLIVAFGLGSGSGGQGTFGPVSYLGNGVYTATFTGTLAGKNTIIATIDGLKVTSKAPAISVLPGTLSYSNSLVTVSSASVSAGGTTTTITFQPRDAAGNKLTLKGLPVSFALGGNGTAQGTFSNGGVAVYKNGVYTATFKGTLVGGSTIVTTVNSEALASNPPVISVTPGTALAANSKLTISEGADTVSSGGSITLMVQAVDANGNLETTGGLKVSFKLASKSGGLGTFGKVTDNKNGTYTVTFTGTTAGTNTIEATIGGKTVSSTVAITVV